MNDMSQAILRVWIICATAISIANAQPQSDGAKRVPTREETEKWIVEKIVSHTWSGEGVTHRYNVSFEDFIGNRMMKIEHIQSSSNPFSNGTYESFYYIRDIVNVYFIKKQLNTWLIIKLNDDLGVGTYLYNKFETKERTISFILTDRINSDDLPNRMKKAFSALVEMCGGTPFYSKEPY